MNTLLIPTDFSPVADNALTYALNMAKAYQLDITLFHVVQVSNLITPDAVYLDSIPGYEAQANEKMDEKVAFLKAQYPDLNITHKVTTGLFLDSMKDFCDEINPVALVMGITGDGGAVDMFLLKHGGGAGFVRNQIAQGNGIVLVVFC